MPSQLAKNILAQLGGNKFIAMTGLDASLLRDNQDIDDDGYECVPAGTLGDWQTWDWDDEG